MHVVALRAAGTTALWLGQFAAAERDLRLCLEALGDGAGYLPFASDLGASPFSLVASDRAAALTVLGRHQEALATMESARQYLAGRNDPFHDCYSLTFSSWIKLELGELVGAAADAGSLVGLATQYQLAALRGLGTALDGIVRAFLADDPRDGVGDVYRGLGEWQASGSALFVSCLFAEAAKVWLRGKRAAGRAALEEAFESAQKSGEGFYIAEMHRLRGEILWQYDKDLSGAESDLGKAWEISGAQQSGTFRLRTAMSLLNLTRERDDLPRRRKAQAIANAKQVLHDVFDSFANEPEFTDVVAARAMIAGASSRGPSETRGSRRARRRTRRNSERND